MRELHSYFSGAESVKGSVTDQFSTCFIPEYRQDFYKAKKSLTDQVLPSANHLPPYIDQVQTSDVLFCPRTREMIVYISISSRNTKLKKGILILVSKNEISIQRSKVLTLSHVLGMASLISSPCNQQLDLVLYCLCSANFLDGDMIQ